MVNTSRRVVEYDAATMTANDARGRRLRSGAVAAVARRPYLWSEAFRSLFVMTRKNWWRTAPFLPTPDPEYLDWRTVTAYGVSSVSIESDDLVAYLQWRRRFRKAMR